MLEMKMLLSITTIVAVLLGPIIAVLVTRWLDIKRTERARKVDIFRTLMKTRRERLSYEHVGALNLIELEFYGDKEVNSAYRAYLDHLGQKSPSQEEEERFFQHRTDLFANLLKALGDSVSLHFDKLDLSRLGYSPVGWENDERLTRRNALMIQELLSGRRAIPITQFQPTIQPTFPPPPVIAQSNDTDPGIDRS